MSPRPHGGGAIGIPTDAEPDHHRHGDAGAGLRRLGEPGGGAGPQGVDGHGGMEVGLPRRADLGRSSGRRGDWQGGAAFGLRRLGDLGGSGGQGVDRHRGTGASSDAPDEGRSHDRHPRPVLPGWRETVRVTDACTACGACLATCPEGALRRAPKRPLVLDSACTACWACIEICPAGAIEEALARPEVPA